VETRTKRLASFPCSTRISSLKGIGGPCAFLNPVAEQMFPIFVSVERGIRGLQIWNRWLRSLRESGSKPIVQEVLSARSGTIKRCISWKMTSVSASTGADITARSRPVKALLKAVR